MIECRFDVQERSGEYLPVGKADTLDKAYLLRLFEETGLEPEEAGRAGEATWLRLVHRTRPDQVRPPKRGDIRAALIRDPMISFNRIVGLGDDRLPFLEESGESLSLVAFATLLDEIGLEPDVALAFAKVIIEAFDPADLFQPVWVALGQPGPVDLEELRRLDWSELRSGLPPNLSGDNSVSLARSEPDED